MVYRPTLKAIAQSKPSGFPQGQRPHGQQKWGIYWFQCSDCTCDDEYI